MDMDRRNLLELATSAARQAGSLVQHARLEDRSAIATKSSHTDIVTAADGASERLIKEIIRGGRPNDAFLGEEEGEAVGTSGCVWIIDPIDGTVNYSRNYPTYAVSVAAAIDGEVGIGVVYDPSRDELFAAVHGWGAHLNGQRLTISGEVGLHEALVGTGFSYLPGLRREQGQILATLLPSVGDIRRIGSAALEICYVAAGRTDAYFETGVKVWDYAAAALIASEAGVSVLLREKHPHEMILVSKPSLTDALSSIIWK